MKLQKDKLDKRKSPFELLEIESIVDVFFMAKI